MRHIASKMHIGILLRKTRRQSSPRLRSLDFASQNKEDIMNSKGNTKFLVELALMVAIIIVMALTPLGYIKTPGLSVTLLTIPVTVGAVMLGPAGGAVCGAAFGLTSFYQTFGISAFGSVLLTINPVGTFITTVVMRVLEGWLTGLIFKALRQSKHLAKASFYIASLACPLLNTLLFMSSLVIFFYNTEYIQGFAQAFGATNPFMFVIAFVGVQGAIEAVICFVVGSILTRTLYKVLKAGGVKNESAKSVL